MDAGFADAFVIVSANDSKQASEVLARSRQYDIFNFESPSELKDVQYDGADEKVIYQKMYD